jgi:hypothetical protein
VKSKWLTIDLAAGSGAALHFTYSRYVNQPTYETPYSSRGDWDPIIKGRDL